MSDEKKPYHHGDLKQSLLDAAIKLLREGGVEALSIRKLADQVGVSRMAPYHHFKDKNELLCALAEEGFRYHEQEVRTIPERFPELSGRELFARYVQAYIRFAVEHPETYDLMFGREIWKNGQPTDSLRQVSKASFRQWVSWVEALQQQGVLPTSDRPLRVAQTSWATLHGLCRLLNDGIYVDAHELEEMAQSTIRLLLRE